MSKKTQNLKAWVACGEMDCKQFGLIKEVVRYMPAERMLNPDAFDMNYSGLLIELHYVCECGAEPNMAEAKRSVENTLESKLNYRRIEIDNFNRELKEKGLHPVDYGDEKWEANPNA